MNRNRYQAVQVVRVARRRAERRGAAAVEFAFVAPLLMLLTFGMVDVGRAVMVQNLLTNAARDGARAAVLDGATVANVEQQVKDYLAASTVPGVTVAITPSPLTSANLGDPVSVTVEIPFDSVSWLPSSWFFGGATLRSTVVMRREVYSDPAPSE
jgi:Flp pilus assembly protein TadG